MACSAIGTALLLAITLTIALMSILRVDVKL